MSDRENRNALSRKQIQHSIALGVCVGLIVKFIVDTLGLKNTILLGIAIYFTVKYWDKIKPVIDSFTK